MKWWVLMDWADSHTVTISDVQPGMEWEGPYDTFTEMRAAILESGRDEVERIQNQLREWRGMRKDEVVLL